MRFMMIMIPNVAEEDWQPTVSMAYGPDAGLELLQERAARLD